MRDFSHSIAPIGSYYKADWERGPKPTVEPEACAKRVDAIDAYSPRDPAACAVTPAEKYQHPNPQRQFVEELRRAPVVTRATR